MISKLMVATVLCALVLNSVAQDAPKGNHSLRELLLKKQQIVEVLMAYCRRHNPPAECDRMRRLHSAPDNRMLFSHSYGGRNDMFGGEGFTGLGVHTG